MSLWIIDANIAASWFLIDELDRDYPLAVLEGLQQNEGLVPVLWVYEIANILVSALRRKRIGEVTMSAIAARMDLLPIATVQPASGGVVRLAELSARHGLTAYDAAYLDLSLQTGASIATRDKQLLIAMEATGVSRVQP